MQLPPQNIHKNSGVQQRFAAAIAARYSGQPPLVFRVLRVRGLRVTHHALPRLRQTMGCGASTDASQLKARSETQADVDDDEEEADADDEEEADVESGEEDADAAEETADAAKTATGEPEPGESEPEEPKLEEPVTAEETAKETAEETADGGEPGVEDSVGDPEDDDDAVRMISSEELTGWELSLIHI